MDAGCKVLIARIIRRMIPIDVIFELIDPRHIQDVRKFFGNLRQTGPFFGRVPGFPWHVNEYDFARCDTFDVKQIREHISCVTVYVKVVATDVNKNEMKVRLLAEQNMDDRAHIFVLVAPPNPMLTPDTPNLSNVSCNPGQRANVESPKKQVVIFVELGNRRILRRASARINLS